MANTINYGLKFNTEDLDRLLKKVAATESKIKDSAKKRYEAESKTASFYEKEMVNLKKQSLMMNKKLTKAHLQELEGLYKHYYTNIKGLDKKSADDLTRQQINNIKQRQKITSSVTNVPLRVAKYLGTSTLLYGGLGALRAGRDAVIEYDQALHNTYMAIGKVTEAEKTMIKSITTNIEFTAKYGKSFVELAKSMEVLVKAGFKVNEATILLEPSLRLAAAGDMELDEAARALSQSLRNVGKPMAYASEMADALATGAAASAVDVKDLITSFEGVGAVGTNFGMQAKEIVAWLGALGNVGLKGRESANAISRLWLRLTKPQKEVVDILKGKGIELFEGNGTEKRIRKFEEIIKDLANASLSLQEKQKLLGIHAGKTAEQIFSAIPSYRALAIEMESISNSAEAMSKAKMEGLQSKIDTMKAAWQDIFVSQNGISNAMGASVDKLKSLFIILAENPELTRLLAIGASAGSAALATGMITKNPYAVGASAIAAAGVSTYLLKDMQGSSYNSAESIAERKKQEELAKKRMQAESDYVNKIANTKLYSLRKLKEEQSALNKELQKYVTVEDEINKKLKTTETQLKQGIIKPADYYSRTGQLQSQKKMNTEQMIASMESFKLRSVQQEITKRQTPIELGTGTGGTTPKEQKIQYDSLEAFLLSLEKLRNKYSERELTGLEKVQAEINNTYLEQQMTLRMKNFQTAEEYYLASVKIAQDKEKSLIEAQHTWEIEQQEKKFKKIEDMADEHSKTMADEYEKRKDLISEYGSIEQRLDLLRAEMQSKLDLVEGNEEAQANIRAEYAEKAMVMFREDWEKKNKIANAALGSMEAGFGSFSQAMSDDLQISKNESEAIWEAMKQSFITKIMEMAWAAALTGIFNLFMPGGSFLKGAGDLLSGFGGNLSDAVVSGGKVYPYRKDDLVMIGTGLGSKSGAQLPDRALPQGTGGMANNNALISELRSLRLAVARSDANNVKAINENTPVIQGKFLDAVDVYKTSKIGERKSNFVVSPK